MYGKRSGVGRYEEREKRQGDEEQSLSVGGRRRLGINRGFGIGDCGRTEEEDS